MYKCHKAQSQICQEVEHLSHHCSTKPTTEDHRDATVQLENEVNFWYKSFCRLIKCQRQYASILCKWIHLTDRLVDGENQNHCPSKVRSLCNEWQLALDRLPEQVTLVNFAFLGFSFKVLKSPCISVHGFPFRTDLWALL